MELEQRLAHGLGNESSHVAFVMEFHLAFGRMNIDVHLGWIEFKE
jgi:hypothetical protein